MPTVQRSMGVNFTKNTGVNQLFFEPVWQAVLQLNNFRVLTNITSKKKLGFVRKLEKILQKDTGCGFNPKGGMDIYDRTIEVDDFKVNLSMCTDEFKDTVFEQLQKSGVFRTDLTGTQMMTALVMAVRDALPNDYQRLFWFGDKTSTDTFYNITDGMWTVHLPDLVNTNQSPYTNSNSGAPLPAGAATDLLKKVYKAQAQVLKGLPKGQKRFFVTTSVWEGYEDDLETLGGGDAGRNQVINGVQVLTYRGIQLVNNPTWDEYMTNDLNSPDSHLVLLTTPDNLILATNVASDLNRVEVWYDRKDEDNSLKVKGKFGTNFVHPAFFSIAY